MGENDIEFANAPGGYNERCVPYWGWIIVFFGGVVVMALTVAARRRVDPDRPPEREGFGSFVYYVLIDWWIDWF